MDVSDVTGQRVLLPKIPPRRHRKDPKGRKGPEAQPERGRKTDRDRQDRLRSLSKNAAPAAQGHPPNLERTNRVSFTT